MDSLPDLRNLVHDVRKHVDHVYAPLFVVQVRRDVLIDINSANIIHDEAESFEKQIKWYEKSGHVIILDQEKELLHKDVLEFLQSLEWQV